MNQAVGCELVYIQPRQVHSLRQQDLFGTSPPDNLEPSRDGRVNAPLPKKQNGSAQELGGEQKPQDDTEQRASSAAEELLAPGSSKHANLSTTPFTPREVEGPRSHRPTSLDFSRDERGEQKARDERGEQKARDERGEQKARDERNASLAGSSGRSWPSDRDERLALSPKFSAAPPPADRDVSLTEIAAQRSTFPRNAQEQRTEIAPPEQNPRKNGEAPRVRIAPRVLSVSELTKQIKETLEPSFSRVIVRGEISGFKGPNSRGHWYFALKDAWAQVDARVWESTAKRLKFTLKDGMEVIAEGNLDLYPPQGRYALIIQKLEPAGVGAQALALEQLKAKLMAEGLFGDRRKKPRRPLPVIPKRVGVVTSITGAALRDFVKVLFRRHPRLSVLVAHARVQGDGAAIDIEGSVRRLARTDCDVIVVTRGGGSMEDLWAFNDERVVRAIFDSPVPVISAVGHEVDVTLADFVADHRAATPSHAAEALAPVLTELELQLAQRRQRLNKAVERSLVGRRAQLDRLARRLGDPRRGLSQHRIQLSEWSDRLVSHIQRAHRDRVNALRDLERRITRASPQVRLKQVRAQFQTTSTRLYRVAAGVSRPHRNRLETLKSRLMAKEPRAGFKTERVHLKSHRERMIQLVRNHLARQRDRIHMLERRLDALSPLKVLGRGYSITRLEDGSVVRSPEQAPAGTLVRILLNDSDQLEARVERTLKENVLLREDR